MALSTTTAGNNPAEIPPCGGDSSIYQFLLDRCRNLETSYANLQEQFHMLEQEQTASNRNNGELEQEDLMASYSDWITVPEVLPVGFSYKRALDSLGHAVYVSKAFSREIFYWNRAAEKLFGYEDYMVLGQRVTKLLMDDDFHLSAEKIMVKLRSGQSWAGQFPFKKRSGETFMALVNKSPLYEDGELIGVITVASDATAFNKVKTEIPKLYPDPSSGQTGIRGLNFKKVQWNPPQQLSSFVSNLTSKDLLRKGGGSNHQSDNGTGAMEGSFLEPQNGNVEKPPKAPPTKRGFGFNIWKRTTDSGEDEFTEPTNFGAKLLSKLNIQRTGNIQHNGSFGIPEGHDAIYTPNNKTLAMADPCQCVFYAEYEREVYCKAHPSLVAKRYAKANEQIIPDAIKEGVSFDATEGESNGSSEVVKPVNQLEISTFRCSRREWELEKDLNLVADCEIRWEDLIFKEEIGHGSFARVYRGIWNQSDVAVKVYFGNQYSEKVLQDYNKEIDIMKRLRHPNVLLFMGSVCSHEKLAMVTELLPRGSLYKILHENNQHLDIRRRLRMAIDVARGMNYLHHRNPPIVHRDLKSSNLLVDKNWSVKVGDFGLSKLKHATFLTARSGRGTPQWMAPEVLRNEPSNEKSDVFSFGIILWELVTQCIPWNNMNPLQVVGVVGFMERRLDLPENLDPSLCSIIQDCWQSNPALRPSFENIIRRMTDIIQELCA